MVERQDGQTNVKVVSTYDSSKDGTTDTITTRNEEVIWLPNSRK